MARKIAPAVHDASCDTMVGEHPTATGRMDCALAQCLRNGHEGTFQADLLRAAGGREPVWPQRIKHPAGIEYVLTVVKPNTFNPKMIVGHYVHADRGVALTLEDARSEFPFGDHSA